MEKRLFMMSLSITLILLIGCNHREEQSVPNLNQLPDESFIFEWSDGTCRSDSECTGIEFGCGGNHIMCTSNSEKFRGMVSTCEVVVNHPSQSSYECACDEARNRCGWVK